MVTTPCRLEGQTGAAVTAEVAVVREPAEAALNMAGATKAVGVVGVWGVGSCEAM